MATQVAELVAQLRADVAQFEASMTAAESRLAGLGAAATKAGSAASTGLAGGFTKAGQTMSAVGTKMSTVGRHLTTSVTLPIAAIGVVATKSALDFNTAFAKIGALAGDIGTSTADAEAHVKALAVATGQAPQDLADSLYFIASAGLKASKVMDTLDITAKAAATGMGSAADIGQTLTSVLNAYAGTGLDAAKSMNILTEAVKLGKAETSDFATGLGPIIGVAANAGVSLNELTGAIAQATNLGVPFARVVTGLRFTIQSLENPTDTAATALKQFGIDATQLAGMVADPSVGLVGTLQYLYNTLASGGAEGRKAWAAITGGARSSIVAVDLVGKHQQQTNNIIKQMGVAAGDSSTVFQDAYAKIQATPAFKFQQALAALKVTAIDLGNVLIPILIHDIIPAIQSVVHWFANLSDGMKSLLVKVSIAAAAGGPILLFVGSILKIGGATAKAIGWLGGLAKAATTTAEAISAANIGGSLAGGAGATSFFDVAGVSAGAGAAGGGTVLGALAPVAGLIGAIGAAAVKTKGLIEDFSTSTGDLANQFGVTETHAQDLYDQLKRGASDWNIFGSETDKAKEALARYNAVVAEATKAGIPASVIQLKLNAAWGDAVHQIGGITGSLPDFQRVLEESLGLAKTTDEVKQLTGAFQQLQEATARVTPIGAAEMQQGRGGVPTGGFPTAIAPNTQREQAALAHLIAVMRTAKANGVDLGQALGPAMAASLTKGTLSIQQWRDAFASAGAKIPYAASQAQGFQQSLLTTTALTSAQKDTLNTLFKSYDQIGVHLDPGIAAFTHAGITAGDFTGIMNVMSNDIKGKVIATFDDLKGSISKTAAAQIEAAIHAKDYAKAAILEAQAEQAAGKAAHFHASAIIGDANATKGQVDQIKKLTGELPNNTKNLSDNVRNLIEQATKADTSKEKIALLHKALDAVKGNYDANLNVDTGNAETHLNKLYAGLQAAGVHIKGWVLDAAKGLAASDDFKGAIGQLASSLTKSSLEQALKGLGNSVSRNTRESIQGKIEAHKYTAALLAIARAANKADEAQKHSVEALQGVTNSVLTNQNAYRDLSNAFIYNNKLSTTQTSTLEHLTEKLYDEGKALNNNQQEAVRAALASNHFQKAQSILQKALDGVSRGANQNAESYKRVNNALQGVNGLTAKQAKIIQDETAALYKSGQSLTAHKAALLADAVAAGQFKKAQDILAKANQTWAQRMLDGTKGTKDQIAAVKELAGQLPNNTSKLNDNTKSLIDQAAKADNAKDKIKLLTQALQSMDGNYVFGVGADTHGATAQVTALFNKMRQQGLTLAQGPGGTPPRQHTGGYIGDKGMSEFAGKRRPDERMIIALRDEMVMSPEATRSHRAELEAMNAGRRHDGGMVDPASAVAQITPWIKALTQSLQHLPTWEAHVEFTDATLKKLAAQFAAMGGSAGVLAAAKTQLGVPYRWGADNPLGPAGGSGAAFDCSGLTMWAAQQVGIHLVHHAATQATQMQNTAKPGPGDLAFFGNPIHHVGIVADRAGQMIDAPHTGAVVQYDPIYSDLNHYGDISTAPGARPERLPTSGGGGVGRRHQGGMVADTGAYMLKRQEVSLMPGEIALAPDSARSVRALAGAMNQAARLHNGGFVPVPPGGLGGGGGSGGGHGGGDGKGGNGDGFHFGKYRQLLKLEKADHIDAILKHVKSLYADDKQKFPTDYVLKTLDHVTRKELHKVAPKQDSIREFVKHLAQNIEPWAGRGHGGGGGGGGNGNGHGGGGIGGGLFGKVFGDFDKTLGMTTTSALADAFVGKLKAEFSATKALNIGEITKVVDAMFQEVPAANYLNALETRWENAVPGKVVNLSDKKGRNYGVTSAILKMLGAHKGTGDGSGGGGDGQGPVAFHFGPYKKLLKLIGAKHIDKVISHVEDLYNSKHDFPTEFVTGSLRHATPKDIHKVAPNQKTVKDFVAWLADRIDHTPGGKKGSGGDGHGGGHGGGGGSGGHLADVVKKLDHVWSQAQSHALSWQEVTDIAHSVGYNQHKGVIMSAISAPESGRQPHPKDNVNTNHSHDQGILQFNSIHHLPNSIVFNPVASFKKAKGWDLSNWSAYKSGAYRHFLGAAQHAWGGWHGGGLDETFTRPTYIGVAESGPERVTVTPQAQQHVEQGDMKIQVRVDRRRFNRDLDYDYIVSGR